MLLFYVTLVNSLSTVISYVKYLQDLHATVSLLKLVHFYRAMLCIRGTSHVPVSVCLCLSVTSRSSTKTAKRLSVSVCHKSEFY